MVCLIENKNREQHCNAAINNKNSLVYVTKKEKYFHLRSTKIGFYKPYKKCYAVGEVIWFCK